MGQLHAGFGETAKQMHPQPNSSSLETAKPEKKRNVKEEIKQLKLLCSAVMRLWSSKACNKAEHISMISQYEFNEKKLDDGECCSCWAKNREGYSE
ncbi:hypothetical protein HPP92_022419 [Vanilla planifolia]|uniref:Uncharacterized protein n=1 Tax=Vanilla planifolia TaxID=51239 RepID=A0A835PS57_VANPL|nr:hypothetical protein HPP92_022419 [Vanilla planifolia]